MELRQFLDSLSDDFESLRQLALRLSDRSQEKLENGFAVSKRPRIAPEAYALWLYTPLPKETIDWYTARFSLDIPPLYQGVLAQLNGLHAFQFSLFGIPPSMAKNPPLLDRSTPQPLDLDTANKHWLHEYSIAAAGLFHFGGGEYSYDENIGYFLEGPQIHAYRKNGDRVAVWTSFRNFLSDELARLEKAYSQFEEFMGQHRQETYNKRRDRPGRRR